MSRIIKVDYIFVGCFAALRFCCYFLTHAKLLNVIKVSLSFVWNWNSLVTSEGIEQIVRMPSGGLID